MVFADKLHQTIDSNESCIVAGFDPRLESMPAFIAAEAGRQGGSNEEAVYYALTRFYALALEALAGSIAGVKPNIAFFEALGIGGLRAYCAVCEMVREQQLVLIADAKRGDIGSTARAYSSAFLGRSSIFGRSQPGLDVDAVTVNPFLGFDTLEVFLEDCCEYGKGIFVLVKTSNPGSAAIQDVKDGEGHTISERIAEWVASAGDALKGECGYSGLGAVVGATYPEQARQLRRLMPDNFFLIPGMGSQGGTAEDSVAGFSSRKGGAVINVSRGLLSAFSSLDVSPDQMQRELKQKIAKFNHDVAEALASDLLELQ